MEIILPKRSHTNVPFAAKPTATLEEVETAHILSTLEHFLGNRSRTASALGICLRTLRYKLKLYESRGMNFRPPIPGPGGKLKNLA